jgi:hypothetical protein
MSILTYAAACTATGCEYTASTQSCNPQYYTCYQSPGSDARCGDAEGSCHMTVCPDQATCSSATTLSIQHTDCPPYPNLNCQPMGMPETVDCTATSQICMNGACVDP